MNNLVVTHTGISREVHEARSGHRGMVLWFTGLSGSGKTSIARGVERALFDQGYRVIVLDGDNVRSGLNSDLGFSDDDRHENLRRVAHVARLFIDQGYVVLVSFISPFAACRKMAREIVGDNYLRLIYLDCPLEVCEARDEKGLYAKARKGEILNLTAIGSTYDTPVSPDLILRTGDTVLVDCVQKVIDFVKSK